jgi:hypothetical protein
VKTDPALDAKSECCGAGEYFEAMMCMIDKASGTTLVEISGVKPIGEVGAETEIEVMIALNPSRTTAIRDWRLELEVIYADGSVRQFSSRDSGRLAEKLVCRVPTRSGEAALINYRAKMMVRFTTVSSVIIHKEFAMPRPRMVLREHPSQINKERIAILDACPIPDDASNSGSMEGIDIRWAAEAPAQAVINRFDLELKATRADGSVKRVCKTVSGVQRQARLPLASHVSEITSIRTGLGATFTWFGSTTAEKSGTFGD